MIPLAISVLREGLSRNYFHFFSKKIQKSLHSEDSWITFALAFERGPKEAKRGERKKRDKKSEKSFGEIEK